MAETFQGLGLRSELGDVTMQMGYTGPTALQRAAIPVLRRGGNAVLHASAGSGVLAAWGLALLDRLAGETGDAGEEPVGGPRALVLVPTTRDAARAAESLARLAAAVGMRVVALDRGWARAVHDADIVVASPARALHAVGTSALKLDSVRALVLDGLAASFALGAEQAVETLTDSVPRDGQRIVTTSEVTREVEDYVERHVRRALRIPAQAVEGTGAVPAEPEHEVGYAVVAEGDKTAALASLLAEREPGSRAVVYCRGEARAAALAEDITLRGFLAAAADGQVTEDTAMAQAAAATAEVEPVEAARGELEREAEVIVSWRDTETLDATAATDTGAALAISYDVPFDADSLAARHVEGGVVLVTPRELPHLRQIAGRAGYAPRSRPVVVTEAAGDEVASYRARVGRAVVEEDIAAQLLVLEPLFEEHSAAEVAAALSALLRRRAPEAVSEAVQAEAAAVGAPPAHAPRAQPAFVKLFVGVGGREGIRPGDLVGAITGETGATGDQVGRIDIRDNFSIVEVATPIAEKVIRALNGTTIKGRSVRVDYDRRPAGGVRGGREGGRDAGRGERPRRRIVRDPRGEGGYER